MVAGGKVCQNVLKLLTGVLTGGFAAPGSEHLVRVVVVMVMMVMLVVVMLVVVMMVVLVSHAGIAVTAAVCAVVMVMLMVMLLLVVMVMMMVVVFVFVMMMLDFLQQLTSQRMAPLHCGEDLLSGQLGPGGGQNRRL